MAQVSSPHLSFITSGALLAAFGVAAGAFGAHVLKEHLTPERLATFETAVRYHLIHAVVLVLIGYIEASQGTSPDTRRAGRSMLLGIALFSGSLYALVASGVSILGAVTPLGGVFLILGWLFLARSGVQHGHTSRQLFVAGPKGGGEG